VPLGETSEISIADVSGVVIRNETRTNETGPLSGTVSGRSKRAPTGALIVPVEYVLVTACAGPAVTRRSAAEDRSRRLIGPAR
jgi:hypothetical protein